ncbi:hypothetical protein N1851_032632 [Merluccius polli]|uniref:Uncharacterized protein n=1 Tax=Merluccius polli TaxID=89951 RepID=A0AA47M2L9_MERPO|nr:hypothetical protein N1851_032632 [Merluccius polli]
MDPAETEQLRHAISNQGIRVGQHEQVSSVPRAYAVRRTPFPANRVSPFPGILCRQPSRLLPSLHASVLTEKQRRYRQRRDADPEKRKKHLEKERERSMKDKDAGKKPSISELNEREKEAKRKYWRAAQAKSRRATAQLTATLEQCMTPPLSPEPAPEPAPGPSRLEFKDRGYGVLHESKYENSRDERERQIISQLVSGKIVKKYQLQKYGQRATGFPRRRWKTLERNPLLFTRKQKDRIPNTFKSKIREFYERDDVSRMTTGKKQPMTRLGVKKQKRLLVDSVLNLHKKFESENPHRALSYSLFCRLRPFWVIHPTMQDRDTCMCKVHENLGFVVDRQKQLNLIIDSSLERLTEEVACSTENKGCMYGECSSCNPQQLPSGF